MSDRFSRFMNHEIGKVNLHLPVKVTNLALVEKMDPPGYMTRKREFVHFNKEEIEWVKSIIPDSEYRRFELPIFLTRRRDLGKGVYVVGGSEVNLYAVRKSLNEQIDDYYVWKMRGKDEWDRYIYNYEIPTINKKLKSLVVKAFS